MDGKQHLIEHLSQTTLIHKDPVAQPVTTTLAERNVAQRHSQEEMRSRYPIWRRGQRQVSTKREADPLSKYLMSFRTVGLFQPLPLQNNSHYIPCLVIIYACGAPKKHIKRPCTAKTHKAFI